MQMLHVIVFSNLAPSARVSCGYGAHCPWTQPNSAFYDDIMLALGPGAKGSVLCWGFPWCQPWPSSALVGLSLMSASTNFCVSGCRFSDQPPSRLVAWYCKKCFRDSDWFDYTVDWNSWHASNWRMSEIACFTCFACQNVAAYMPFNLPVTSAPTLPDETWNIAQKVLEGRNVMEGIAKCSHQESLSGLGSRWSVHLSQMSNKVGLAWFKGDCSLESNKLGWARLRVKCSHELNVIQWHFASFEMNDFVLANFLLSSLRFFAVFTFFFFFRTCKKDTCPFFALQLSRTSTWQPLLR